MGIKFSASATSDGIVEQTRAMMRVDSTQWSTANIMNSCNNWLNKIFTRGKNLDIEFQIDDTNHTALPEGKEDLVISQSDYSFLVDQQGNRITNLTSVSILINSKYVPLTLINRNDPNYDASNFGTTTGTPSKYDKIADNIIRLDKQPLANLTDGLFYTFQRSPSYFVVTDTTKQPGVADDLHRGFVVASAYDGALTLGLSNLQALSIELQKEEQKLTDYISSRNTDKKGRLTPKYESNK